MYQALGRRAAETGLDCSRMVVVMMDDYLESAAGPPTLAEQAAHYSCRRFAEVEIRRVPVFANFVPHIGQHRADPIDRFGLRAGCLETIGR